MPTPGVTAVLNPSDPMFHRIPNPVSSRYGLVAALACVGALLAACGGGGAVSSSTSDDSSVNTNITAKYSSLNTAVGNSSPDSTTPVSGTGSSTSTAGVGCGAGGTGITDTGVVNANNTANITSTVTTAYNYSWTCSGSMRTLTANGIANHAVGVFPNSGNPNAISTQSVTASIKLAPTLAAAANYNAQPTGYGLNGIKFDANTGGGCVNSATSPTNTSQCDYLGGPWAWSLEALVSVTPFDFGADSNLAHVQPGGAYHYHGAPARLFSALGGTLDSAGLPTKMVLIGWAVDGYPLYYKVGYKTASDSSSTLVALKGNYLPNSTSSSNSARPSSSVFPKGTFKNDWAYSASNGGDLDECNGRTGVTPEFPTGIYYYVVTDTYPFAPRCVKGTT